LLFTNTILAWYKQEVSAC